MEVFKFYSLEHSADSAQANQNNQSSSITQATFTLFPNLPPELRWNIWREALHSEPRVFELVVEDLDPQKPNLVPETFVLSQLGHVDDFASARSHGGCITRNPLEMWNYLRAMVESGDRALAYLNDPRISAVAEHYQTERLIEIANRANKAQSILLQPFWPWQPDELLGPGQSGASIPTWSSDYYEEPPMMLHKISSPKCIPSLLVVNSEARRAAKRYLVREFIGNKIAYVNFEIDTFFLSKETNDRNVEFLLDEFLSSSICEKIHHLAIDKGLWQQIGTLATGHEGFEGCECWEAYGGYLKEVMDGRGEVHDHLENTESFLFEVSRKTRMLETLVVVHEEEYMVLKADETKPKEVLVFEDAPNKIPDKDRSHDVKWGLEAWTKYHSKWTDVAISIMTLDRCGDAKRERRKASRVKNRRR